MSKSQKTLTADDLVIGNRYVPHDKTAGETGLEKAACWNYWRHYQTKNEGWLFYCGFDFGHHLFSHKKNGKFDADYFNPSDVTAYKPINKKNMNTKIVGIFRKQRNVVKKKEVQLKLLKAQVDKYFNFYSLQKQKQ